MVSAFEYRNRLELRVGSFCNLEDAHWNVACENNDLSSCTIDAVRFLKTLMLYLTIFSLLDDDSLQCQSAKSHQNLAPESLSRLVCEKKKLVDRSTTFSQSIYFNGWESSRGSNKTKSKFSGLRLPTKVTISNTETKQMRGKATNMTETGHTQFIGPDWVCVLRPHGTVT